MPYTGSDSPNVPIQGDQSWDDTDVWTDERLWVYNEQDAMSARTTFVESDLIVGVNSAATLADANKAATIKPKMDSWFLLTTSQQIASLMNSYNELSRISFCFKDFEWMDHDGETHVSCVDLKMITSEDFLRLPPSFLSALAEASVANSLHHMDCDNAAMQRADGIMQSRTNETSHMFRPGMPLRYPVPRHVIDIVCKWVCPNNINIQRSA